MSIRTEVKEIVTCDFCGAEYEPSEVYPRNRYGELAKFNLSLTFSLVETGTGSRLVYGEDSPMMGYCSGHICTECLHEITKRIEYNKAHKKESD